MALRRCLKCILHCPLLTGFRIDIKRKVHWRNWLTWAGHLRAKPCFDCNFEKPISLLLCWKFLEEQSWAEKPGGVLNPFPTNCFSIATFTLLYLYSLRSVFARVNTLWKPVGCQAAERHFSRKVAGRKKNKCPPPTCFSAENCPCPFAFQHTGGPQGFLTGKCTYILALKDIMNQVSLDQEGSKAGSHYHHLCSLAILCSHVWQFLTLFSVAEVAEGQLLYPVAHLNHKAWGQEKKGQSGSRIFSLTKGCLWSTWSPAGLSIKVSYVLWCWLLSRVFGKLLYFQLPCTCVLLTENNYSECIFKKAQGGQ